MADRLEFWKGVTVGLLAGMAAAALARLAAPPILAADGRGEILKPSGRHEHPDRRDTVEFQSRREKPESAGDPAQLSPHRAGSSSTGFERQGGAPGGLAEAERLEMPGRPGQLIDHSDASAPVQATSRTLDLHGGPTPSTRQDWSS